VKSVWNSTIRHISAIAPPPIKVISFSHSEKIGLAVGGTAEELEAVETMRHILWNNPPDITTKAAQNHDESVEI